MSHPAKLADADADADADACASAIGPAGVLTRALVGITLIALAPLWRDPDSQTPRSGSSRCPG